MGSDPAGWVSIIATLLFQSTLPGWGATEATARTLRTGDISIHAPRMGSDREPSFRRSPERNFNPRSPDGERPVSPYAERAHGGHFNPRSPDGERQPVFRRADRRGLISIHAPRMGSDRENGHLRPRYGQNHPFSTLIVSQIVVDVLGTVRKSQKTPAH